MSKSDSSARSRPVTSWICVLTRARLICLLTSEARSAQLLVACSSRHRTSFQPERCAIGTCPVTNVHDDAKIVTSPITLRAQAKCGWNEQGVVFRTGEASHRCNLILSEAFVSQRVGDGSRKLRSLLTQLVTERFPYTPALRALRARRPRTDTLRTPVSAQIPAVTTATGPQNTGPTSTAPMILAQVRLRDEVRSAPQRAPVRRPRVSCCEFAV